MIHTRSDINTACKNRDTKKDNTRTVNESRVWAVFAYKG